MNNYPDFAQIDGELFKINTDYKVALKCDKINRDSSITDEERSLAIIYSLFGEKGLNDNKNWDKLKEIAVKYLNCGKEHKNSEEAENMSYEQDMDYIRASFFSDYNIDLDNTKMHWWQFYNLLCGLTEDSILNRVRFVRDFDISQIKDRKEKEKWIKQKEQVALKEEKRQKTSEEKRLDELFEKQLRGE